MNIFKQLLEIKTWNEDLEIKKVYLDELVEDKEYCSYFYDIVNHSIYINNLNYKYSNNILESIINKSYKQELKKCSILSKTYKPNIHLFYYSSDNKLVVIDRINIKAIRNGKWKILKLKVWM